MNRHLSAALLLAALISLLSLGVSNAQSEPALPVVAPVAQWGNGTPRDIAWTPEYLAVASSAGVYIFDSANLDAPPRTLEPMDTWPSQLASDPANPNRLAVLNGSAVTIWDVANGTPLLHWRTGGANLSQPAFSADGTRLLAHNGVQAFVWDAQTGALVQTFGDDSAPISSAALSPDGELVFSGSRRGSLALWDVASGEQVAGDFPYSEALGLAQTISVAFSPDGRSIISGDSNGHIRLWSVRDLSDTVEYERIYRGDPNTPRALEIRFLHGGRFVTAEDSASGGVRLWQVGDAITEIAAVDPPGFSRGAGLAVSPDGAQVVAIIRTQGGGYAEIIDVESFEISARVGQFRDIQRFSLSDDGSLLATEGLGPQELLNTFDGSRLTPLHLNTDYLTGSAISPDNALVTGCVTEAAMSYDPRVVGWSVHESSEPFTLLEEFAFISGGQCDRTFISGETLGFVSYDGVYTRPRIGGDFARVLAAPEGTRSYSAFAGTLGLIGAAGSGFTVFEQADPAANPHTFTLPWTPRFDMQVPVSVALDVAGTRMVRTGETQPEAIDFYDISGDDAVLLYSAIASSPINALALSHDGHWMASGGRDGAVTLWDVEAGRALVSLSGSFGAATTLAFSPSGDHLYATGQDSVIKVWALDTLP